MEPAWSNEYECESDDGRHRHGRNVDDEQAQQAQKALDARTTRVSCIDESLIGGWVVV